MCLLVLQALPGHTLRDALHGSSGPWPQIGELTSLVDRLPGLFVKVVRPDRARVLHDRHRLIVASGVPAAQRVPYDPDLQGLPAAMDPAAMRIPDVAPVTRQTRPGMVMPIASRHSDLHEPAAVVKEHLSTLPRS
jgi:hypothetical protein